MKIIAIAVCTLITCLNVLNGQSDSNLFRGNQGRVDFESTAPLEIIKASSTTLQGVLNIQNRDFAFSIPISSFEGFNSPLQQVHFNENYLESDQYPKASFQGRIIEDIPFDLPGEYDARAKGQFAIHGVSNERIIRGKVEVGADFIELRSQFSVRLDDYNIKIPKIVRQKIAEEILITMKIKMNR